MKAWATNRAADGKPGVWSLTSQVIVDGLGDMDAAQGIIRRARGLGNDAHVSALSLPPI